MLWVEAAVPIELPIAGLFNVIDESGNFDLEQAEHQAAFLMALKEINDKSDGLFDDILPHTTLTYSIRSGVDIGDTLSSVVAVTYSPGGDKVVGVVNALPDKQALFSEQYFVEKKVPQVITESTSYQFNNNIEHPYAVRTIGLVSYQGMVLQSLMCTYFKAMKFVLMVPSSALGGVLSKEFLDEPHCALEQKWGAINIPEGLDDFSDAIAEALGTGARYYVMLTAAKETAMILEQGYNAGLFGHDTVIVNPTIDTESIFSYFSPGADVASIMRGYFTVEFWPNFYRGSSPEWASFATDWRAQPSTAGSMVGGSRVCDATKDGSGSFYLYRSQTNASVCTGIDFSTFDAQGTDIIPTTPLTYDGTVLLAKALHFIVENGLDYTDPTMIQTVLINNVSMVGASGPIEIFGGSPQFSYKARGNRETGLHFFVNNFNVNEYKHGRQPMVHVGVWSGDDSEFFDCSSSVMAGQACFEPEYWSMRGRNKLVASNVPPADAPAPLYKLPIDAETGVIYAMAAITLIVVLAFFVMVLLNTKAKPIKAAQPILLYCILGGGLVATLRVFVGAAAKSDAICAAEFWLGHLAFAIMVGSLFVKSWRVHCIVNTKTLRKVKFTSTDAALMLAGIVSVVLVYLAVAHGVGQPMLKHTRSEAKNQVTLEPHCGMYYAEFETALFAMEFVFLVFVFRVCWETRNVPDVVNESKSIAAGMSVIVVVCVLALPVIFLLGLPADITEVIASLSFGFATLLMLLLLFMPKWLSIRAKMHQSGKGSVLPVNGSGTEEHKDEPADQRASSNVVDVIRQCLSTVPRDQRIGLCAEYAHEWQAELMRLNASLLRDNKSGNSEESSTNAPSSSGQIAKLPGHAVAYSAPQYSGSVGVGVHRAQEEHLFVKELAVQDMHAVRVEKSSVNSVNVGPDICITSFRVFHGDDHTVQV